eukprot:8300424-Lingulodinium_polyedra.AAC.1
MLRQLDVHERRAVVLPRLQGQHGVRVRVRALARGQPEVRQQDVVAPRPGAARVPPRGPSSEE